MQINETTLVSYSVAGSLDRFGNCKGTNFKSNRGEWENAIVQAKYKIYLSEDTAIANSKDNTLILPSGTKIKLSDNYVVLIRLKAKPYGVIIIIITKNKISLFYLMV